MLGLAAVMAGAGTVVGMSALRSMRRDSAGYSRRWITGSMLTTGFVGLWCAPLALVLLYLGAGGAVVGQPARTFGVYLAYGAVFSLLGYVCVATVRDMGRCRKQVQP